MTLGDMTIQGQDLLGETEGTAGAASPFAWKRNLKNAADTVARATHAVYRTFSLDLVAGQSDYCAPPLYHITAGSVLDVNGVAHTLRLIKSLHYVPRDAAPLLSQAGPQAMTVLGANTVRVYDTPAYSTTGSVVAVAPALQGAYGLALEGFGVVSDLWDAPLDVCPLPPRGHLAALYLATSHRAAQMKDFPTAQYYDGLYRAEQGLLEAEAATVTAAQSGRRGSPGALSLSAFAGAKP